MVSYIIVFKILHIFLDFAKIFSVVLDYVDKKFFTYSTVGFAFSLK